MILKEAEWRVDDRKMEIQVTKTFIVYKLDSAAFS